ncbi:MULTISPECIES: hypothetical protein [unclassified Streptomyces]|uniref:Transposase n=1 Tax=Streptomyces sp. NBC_00119 TaxID=2975659 RepID=A0AAU1UPF4_9ACTN|nr:MULTISPECIES: hypothetical protein [unclassified Streptomyces]MCX4644064.1 hypothetical protein [Streptomyces sp. NBC_01446]MCX5325176.1 hypothetical protein [Streptomyces sp. NBC_00120]
MGFRPRKTAVQQVEQIDRWIATEERREIERRHGEQARPPAPDWPYTSAVATWRVSAPVTSTEIRH